MAVITGNDLVATERQYEWVAYVWGGSNPQTGWDCSGMQNWIFGGIYHLAIPGFNAHTFDTFSGHGPVVADWIQWIGVAKGMWAPGRSVAGDIIAWGPNQHMGLAIDGNRFVSAANPFQGTFEADIGSFFNYTPYILRNIQIQTGATAPLGTVGYTPPAAKSMTNWAGTIGAAATHTRGAAANLSRFASAIRRT